MTAPDPQARDPAPGRRPPSPFLALYRTLLGTLVTRGRVLALAALGAATVAVGLAIGVAGGRGARGGETVDRADAAVRFVNSVGLSVLVPVVALVFASAAFGDLVDEGTLVYLWLRPLPRHHLALAAFGAALTIAAPLTILPVVLAAALTGAGAAVVAGAAASAAVAVIAYTGVFCALGLRLQRALVWGLAYILIWEGFVASAGRGASRFAIRAYTRSLLSGIADVPLRLSAIGPVVAVAVPLGVTALAILFTTRRLGTTDVP